jgi:hypothetical protein
MNRRGLAAVGFALVIASSGTALADPEQGSSTTEDAQQSESSSKDANVAFAVSEDATAQATGGGDKAQQGHTIYPWFLVAYGAVTFTVGAVLVASAPDMPAGCNEDAKTCARLPNETQDDFKQRQTIAGRASSQPTAGGVTMVIGGAMVLGGLLWHFLEPTGPKSTARAQVRVTPGGVFGTF